MIFLILYYYINLNCFLNEYNQIKSFKIKYFNIKPLLIIHVLFLDIINYFLLNRVYS